MIVKTSEVPKKGLKRSSSTAAKKASPVKVAKTNDSQEEPSLSASGRAMRSRKAVKYSDGADEEEFND